MTSKLWKLAPAAAWAIAALSSATPADATMISLSSASTFSYASCSANATPKIYDWCDSFQSSYIQTIKLVTTPCNSGGVCSTQSTVYTDVQYAAGRKDASPSGGCQYLGKQYYFTQLASCTC
jgi:hypothetical protein